MGDQARARVMKLLLLRLCALLESRQLGGAGGDTRGFGVAEAIAIAQEDGCQPLGCLFQALPWCMGQRFCGNRQEAEPSGLRKVGEVSTTS